MDPWVNLAINLFTSPKVIISIIKIVVGFISFPIRMFQNPEGAVYKLGAQLNMIWVTVLFLSAFDNKDLAGLIAIIVAMFPIIAVITILGGFEGAMMGGIVGILIGNTLEDESKVSIISYVVLVVFLAGFILYQNELIVLFDRITYDIHDDARNAIVIGIIILPLPFIIALSFILDVAIYGLRSNDDSPSADYEFKKKKKGKPKIDPQ